MGKMEKIGKLTINVCEPLDPDLLTLLPGGNLIKILDVSNCNIDLVISVRQSSDNISGPICRWDNERLLQISLNNWKKKKVIKKKKKKQTESYQKEKKLQNLPMKPSWSLIETKSTILGWRVSFPRSL